jgi:hypothetical protein
VFTPYVKSIDLGGGLCGQSVCFISTVMLESFANRVCGLGEITAYAHDGIYGEIAISEITSERMRKYFKNVALCMTEQVPGAGDAFTLDSPQALDFELALRGYLRSGMPVIFPTDARKLADPAKARPKPSERSRPASESIYRRNGWPARLDRFPEEKNHRHCVVLIGYRDLQGPRGTEFIFHDPSALPYMHIHLEELLVVASDHPTKTGLWTDVGVFMPVTSAMVRLPLLNVRHAAGGPYDAGLVCILRLLAVCVEALHEKVPPVLYELLQRRLGIEHAEFQLLQPPVNTAQSLPWHNLALSNVIEDLRNPIAQKIAACTDNLLGALTPVGSHPGAPGWVWAESYHDMVWLWDAGVAPLRADLITTDPIETVIYSYLRMVIYPKEGKLSAIVVARDRSWWPL